MEKGVSTLVMLCLEVGLINKCNEHGNYNISCGALEVPLMLRWPLTHELDVQGLLVFRAAQHVNWIYKIVLRIGTIICISVVSLLLSAQFVFVFFLVFPLLYSSPDLTASSRGGVRIGSAQGFTAILSSLGDPLPFSISRTAWSREQSLSPKTPDYVAITRTCFHFLFQLIILRSLGPKPHVVAEVGY